LLIQTLCCFFPKKIVYSMRRGIERRVRGELTTWMTKQYK